MKRVILIYLLFVFAFASALDFNSAGLPQPEKENIFEKGKNIKIEERKVHPFVQDIEAIKNYIFINGNYLLGPIISMDSRGCYCSQNEIVKHVQGYIKFLREDDISKDCSINYLYIQDALPVIIQTSGYSTVSVSNWFTCDGVFQRGNVFGIVKEGIFKKIEKQEGIFVITIERDFSTFKIKISSGLTEVLANYDQLSGLTILNVKLPSDFSSKTELLRKDEKFSKNLNKIPIYLSAYYNNQRISDNTIFRDPIAYLDYIVRNPYDIQEFIEAGFNLIEIKQNYSK